MPESASTASTTTGVSPRPMNSRSGPVTSGRSDSQRSQPAAPSALARIATKTPSQARAVTSPSPLRAAVEEPASLAVVGRRGTAIDSPARD